MSVKIRVKRNRVYLDIIQNRKHHWEKLNITLSTDPATRKEQMRLADVCRAKREMQVLCGAWNMTDSVAGKRLLADYLRGLQEKAVSASRKQTFTNLILRLGKYPKGNIQLSAIDSVWVQDFQIWLEKQSGLKSSSVNLYLSVLRQAFNAAVKERILTHSPANGVKNVKAEEADLPTLTVEELRALAKVEVKSELAKDCKKAFLFSCYTGLRVSDLATLRWGDITARQGKGGIEHWIKKRQVKTRRFVEEPINAVAWTLIKPSSLVLPMPENFVFPELASSKYLDYTNRYIKSLAKAAGITKNIAWHTARRTFATLGLENGIDPFTIQRLMGHSKVTMTAAYAKSDGIKSAAVGTFADIFTDGAADGQAAREA